MVPGMKEPQTTTIVCRTFNSEGDERGRSVTVQILDDHVVVLGEDASGITVTAQQANTMSRALAGFSALLEPGTTPAMAQQEEITYQELLESVESEKNERLRRELAEAKLAKVQGELDELRTERDDQAKREALAKAKSAGAPRITLEQAVARGDSHELGKWAAEYAASLDYERQLHGVTKDVLTRTTRELYELSGGELAHARLRQVTRERDEVRADLEIARTAASLASDVASEEAVLAASAMRDRDEWHRELEEAREELAKVTAEHDDARHTLVQCSEALVTARDEANEARRANDALHAQRDIDLAEIAIAREDLEQAEAERDTARAASERCRVERDACFAQLASMHANHAIVLECWSVTARSLDAANEACQQAERELRAARSDEQPSCTVSAQAPIVRERREVHEAGTTDLRGPWAMVGRVSGDANHGDGEPVDAELSEVIVRLVNGSTTSAPVAWAGTPPINLAIGYPFVGMEDRANTVVTLGGIMLQPDNARTLGRYLVKAADQVTTTDPTVEDVLHTRVSSFVADADLRMGVGDTMEMTIVLGRGRNRADGDKPTMWLTVGVQCTESDGLYYRVGAK